MEICRLYGLLMFFYGQNSAVFMMKAVILVFGLVSVCRRMGQMEFMASYVLQKMWSQGMNLMNSLPVACILFCSCAMYWLIQVDRLLILAGS